MNCPRVVGVSLARSPAKPTSSMELILLSRLINVKKGVNMINPLPRRTGKKILISLRSPYYRFTARFCLGLFSIWILGLALGDYAVAATGSDNQVSSLLSQFKFPRNSLSRVLETVGLFAGGIVFCVFLDRWFSKRSAISDNTPLAQQARKLRQLKMGYPEGMTNLEVLRAQGFLEKRLEPLGLSVTWSSFLSASSLIERFAAVPTFNVRVR